MGFLLYLESAHAVNDLIAIDNSRSPLQGVLADSPYVDVLITHLDEYSISIHCQNSYSYIVIGIHSP